VKRNDRGSQSLRPHTDP